MSNVLPEEAKKKLYRSMRMRFVLMLALVLALCALIAAAALAPVFVSIRIAQASVQRAQDTSGVSHDDQAKVAHAQVYVDALSPMIGATSSPSYILSVAIGLKPTAISITSMSYARGTIVLNGTSRSREAVSVFRDALQANPRFTTVAVPVAALVGVQEGRFTMTLSGAY